jgi:hypothetical protein
MEIEWAQILVGAIGGGGIVGFVTQLWTFNTQLREERKERARARLQELTLKPEFMELLAAISRMTVLMKREHTADEFAQAIKAYEEAMSKPINDAVMFFLPDVIAIRLYVAWDLLAGGDHNGAQIELAKLADSLKERLGLDVLDY